MTRLSPVEYLAHLRSESASFRGIVAECEPQARVPSCPAWDAADLLWHLTGVQAFWAWILDRRPTGPQEWVEADRPATYAELLGAFDQAHRDLVAALDGADPAEEAWTWSSEHTVGFILRRQAHEVLIHRLDAELAAHGTIGAIDPTLGADGVDEVLDVMYGGCPPWGTFAPLPHYVRVDATDASRSVWVQLGHFDGTDPDGVTHHEDDIQVVADPGVEPDAVVSGEAGVLLARLWRRGPGDDLKVTGDLAIVDHFRAAIHHPIN